MLEANKEYIALVSKHLIPEQLVWWVKEDATDWNAFYCFLEKQAKVACQVQVLRNICLGCTTPADDSSDGEDHTTGVNPSSSCEEEKVECSPTPAEDLWDAIPDKHSSDANSAKGRSLHCTV